MTLSIMIPTIGRPCLSKVLEELRGQLELGDEVLVIGDGPVNAGSVVMNFGPQFQYFQHGPDHFWGHPQRNYAMPLSKGTHLMSFDDDDAIYGDALQKVRAAIFQYPDSPLMFRMNHGPGVIWQAKEVADGNVSTQMFVTPNVRGKLGVWGRRYQGDLDFIMSTIALYPKNSLIWREEVTAIHGIGGNAPR